MASKPLSLAEHLQSYGNLFKYDELVGSVISTELTEAEAAESRTLLKTNFFDTFGFCKVDCYGLDSRSKTASPR